MITEEQAKRLSNLSEKGLLVVFFGAVLSLIPEEQREPLLKQAEEVSSEEAAKSDKPQQV